ncbi:MAG: NAD-dependent epimerase/dehydratase family protein, partial [Archaeoglobaceae archaeon]
MEKILVTGASGFLGGHLTRKLADEGYNVFAMVRKTSDTSRLEGIDKRYADLLDYESLKEATKGVDIVIHLGAYYTFYGKKELYQKINVEGTKNLLEAVLKNGVKRFIYCSTTEVIGPVKNPPADESTPPNPEYEYGKSKLKAEELVRSYANKGIEFTILRPSGIYGPYNVDDVSYWFITSFAKNSLATKFIVSSGENLIQFVHVSDVVNGFLLAIEKENSVNQTYIISEDKAYTYNQVYRILAEILGREAPKFHIPVFMAKAMIFPVELTNRLLGRENFMWHVKTVDSITKDRAYSVEKAKRELGYRPKYDLKTGLKETVEWYRENGFI